MSLNNGENKKSDIQIYLNNTGLNIYKICYDLINATHDKYCERRKHSIFYAHELQDLIKVFALN
jgi:hypothetical protein